MAQRYLNGYVMDYSVYPHRRLPAHLTCAASGVCVCGFCKGEGMCDFGDCHNMLPTVGTVSLYTGKAVTVVGTLCLDCSAVTWRTRMPGHRASV